MMLKKKKLPYYFLLFLLTTGASLILGLLSFGGMYVLFPLLPLAIASFALSVSYEGEIYLQNIKGALSKLFKPFHAQRQLAKQFLLENFPKQLNDETPQFFKDYAKQLRLYKAYENKYLTKECLKRKQQIAKTIFDMEKWFALELFTKGKSQQSQYQKDLQNWLQNEENVAKKENLTKELIKQKRVSVAVKIFSILSASFMSLGTTYLLVEVFSAIPILAAMSFAAWPIIIVPMAIIAGTAYGLLTYNAVTDMINNRTLQNWYNSLKNDFEKDGITIKNIFQAITAVALLSLAVALTVCTMGTWWTVAKESRPLFNWMKKMPGFIMGIYNPAVAGISALIFNLQNTSESMDLLKGIPDIFRDLYKGFIASINFLKTKENILQILNPFRIILKLTITPLRILLFLGHLISIGVTSDRVPGISQVFTALLGIISEGFEDLHYFFEHSHSDEKEDKNELVQKFDEDFNDLNYFNEIHVDCHHNESEPEQQTKLSKLLEERRNEHNHSHGLDLPTQVLKLIFAPLYFLAATWDWLSSKNNTDGKTNLTFKQALNKQWHGNIEQTINITHEPKLSREWQKEHTKFHIEKFKAKHLNLNNIWIRKDIAKEKIKGLDEIATHIDNLNKPNPSAQSISEENEPTSKKLDEQAHNETHLNDISSFLTQAKTNEVFQKPRLFGLFGLFKPETQEFVENKFDRVISNKYSG